MNGQPHVCIRERLNLRCPECGQSESIYIEVVSTATMTASGFVAYSGTNWGENSYCSCPECDHEGSAGMFVTSVGEVLS